MKTTLCLEHFFNNTETELTNKLRPIYVVSNEFIQGSNSKVCYIKLTSSKIRRSHDKGRTRLYICVNRCTAWIAVYNNFDVTTTLKSFQTYQCVFSETEWSSFRLKINNDNFIKKFTKYKSQIELIFHDPTDCINAEKYLF